MFMLNVSLSLARVTFYRSEQETFPKPIFDGAASIESYRISAIFCSLWC